MGGASGAYRRGQEMIRWGFRHRAGSQHAQRTDSRHLITRGRDRENILGRDWGVRQTWWNGVEQSGMTWNIVACTHSRNTRDQTET